MVHVLVQRHFTRDEPMPPWETVDLAKLETALVAPQKTYFGKEFYPSLADKAAVLLYSMVKAHPWANGNKRMGMIATFVFVGLNGRWWQASQADVYAHVTWVAASEARCHKQAVEYLGGYFAAKLVPWDPQTS